MYSILISIYPPITIHISLQIPDLISSFFRPTTSAHLHQLFPSHTEKMNNNKRFIHAVYTMI